MLRAVVALLGLVITVSPQSSPTDPSALIRQLSTLRLDPRQVFAIHDITIHRDVLSISFNRGAIAFIAPVNGRVTGAVFLGEGEIVAIPSDANEGRQLARYTQSPVLSQEFDAALFRFTDDSYAEIIKALQEHAQEDVEAADRERLFAMDGELERRSGDFNHRILLDILGRGDRPAFVAALKSEKLGWFTAAYDQRAPEEVRIGAVDAVWASFNRRAAAREDKAVIDVLSYDVDSTIASDMRLTAKASIRFRGLRDGERVLGFILAPSLRVESVTAAGQPAVFSRNGARLSVVLPQPLKAQQESSLDVQFAGDAIVGASAASPGVSRPFWYPASDQEDRARFSLKFQLPAGFEVLATNGIEALSAGFVISKCMMHSRESGGLVLSACLANDSNADALIEHVRPIADFYEKTFGSLPYKALQLSTLPGVAVQSEPTLVYAPLAPALNREQRAALGVSEADVLTLDFVFAREVARQWFGHAAAPKTYRDRWIVDGLAAYAAAMFLETRAGDGVLRQILGRSRLHLTERSPEGAPYGELAPIALGPRLTQPLSTEGYIFGLENKSMWAIHALRTQMRRDGDDARFLAMVRELSSQSRGDFITTDGFRRLAEKHAGEPLDSFFTDWVFAPGIPPESIP